MVFRFSNMYHSIKQWHNYQQHYHVAQKMYLDLVSCSWLSFWHMHNWVIYYLVQWLWIINHLRSRCKFKIESIVYIKSYFLALLYFVSFWVILILMVKQKKNFFFELIIIYFSNFGGSSCSWSNLLFNICILCILRLIEYVFSYY